MLYAGDNDKLPTQELGRELRDLTGNIVAEPMPDEMVVILDRLKLQQDAKATRPLDPKSPQ